MDRSPVARFLLTFAKEQRGVVAVEFAIMMPVLIITFMSLYVYFDGYRQSTVNLKAAYTISDVISRETNAISDDYVDTMQSMFGFLTRADELPKLRVTIVYWSEDDNRYFVDWSKHRGMGGVITDDNITDMVDRLPVMADGDRLIVVETLSMYEPVYNIGMSDRPLRNFIVTRPRFAPQVVWSDEA